MDKAKGECAHANCTCAAAADSKFCSANCEAAKNVTDISCEWGHSGCEGNVAKAS